MATERTTWEDGVITAIERELQIPTSDAQGIFEGQPFAVAQAWGRGSTAEEAAELVIVAATPGKEGS